MSRSRSTHVTRIGILLAVVVATAGTARADRVSFFPSAELESTYTDNVRIIDNVSGSKPSDIYTTLALVLPVSRQFRRTNLGLSYAGSYTKYREYDTLDHSAHRLALDIKHEPDLFTTWAFNTTYTRTQEQGTPDSIDSADLYLNRRNDRESYGAWIDFQKRFGSRWDLDTSVSAQRDTFQGIGVLADDNPDEEPQFNLEDRTAYMGSLGLGRTVSRRTTIGAVYQFNRFDLADSGNEDVHSLGMTLARQFSQFLRIKVEVGGYKRDRKNTTLEQPDANNNDSGLQTQISIDYDKPLRGLKLGVEAGIRPASGGSLPGTSTDTLVGFSVSSAENRSAWNWGVYTRYAQRDPTDPDLPTVSSYSFGGSAERGFSDKVGLRISGIRVTQGSSGPGIAEGSFYMAGLRLVWYFRGRDRKREV